MSFDSVLVANRGEIAVRVIRACRRLGLRSVAVFSDADAGAMHVEPADEALRIGPAEAASSYLDAGRIIAAAQAAGAGAVHPGYGFLAENADFARRCAEAGLVFVGPSPKVIADMGAKIAAKRIAEQVGVPCVPGYHGGDQDDATLLREARRIGTPLLIKASAGGGGRGMRRVDDLADFKAALALARSESKTAFGDATVLLEKYVEAPRHVEVQVLGDRHGNVRHLYERDCSVQRNYQKVIEEAPAPNLDRVLRARMLEDAVKLARAIGYDNAGTVEFVVDTARNAAYFLEMNTRLQVEHPVTEAVTGIDLVEWQLRIAAGEPIGFTQDQVTLQGCAIEARVAAEDPAEGYRPQTGRILACEEPAGEGLRLDSGVRAGSEVTPYYDSMLAKLIAHAGDRDSAIRRLRAGLAAYRIEGVQVNIPFLRDVLALPEFAAGRQVTGLLAAAWPQGWAPPALADRDLAHAALARYLHAQSQRPPTVWSTLGAWRTGEPAGRRGAAYYHLRTAGPDGATVEVRGRDGSFSLRSDGRRLLETEGAQLAGGILRYREGDRQVQVRATVTGERVNLQGGLPPVEVLEPERALLGKPAEAADRGSAVRAPTPGLVVDVLAAPGQRIAKGEPLVVLEAMKMVQHLLAPRDSTIAAVHCRKGDAVNGGELLVSLAAEGAGA